MATGSNSESKQKIESKPVVENKAGAETQGKSKKPLILIISLALVVILGGAAFLVLPFGKGIRAAVMGKSESSDGEKSEKKEKKEEVKSTLALEPFLVNLADAGENRFVKTTFNLGLAEEQKEEEKAGPGTAAIRDSIISILSSKKAEEILTPEGKDKLRHEIRARVNSVSPKMNVLEVYIVDFVIQL